MDALDFLSARGLRASRHGQTDLIWVTPKDKVTDEIREYVRSHRSELLQLLSERDAEHLGDWTERQLKKIGITQDRYRQAKKLFGLAPTCGCGKRKEWLNAVSKWWRSEQ